MATKGKLSERLQMRGQIHKAYKVMLKIIDPKFYKEDKAIPLALIKNAKGLVFVTVVRAGFVVTGSVGAGIVISRLPNGEWSPPSSIGVGGVGFGAQIGANATDTVIILNTEGAVKAFSGKGNIKLGGNLSVAVGPVGREGDAAVTKGSLKDSKLTACYSYSHSRGLFAGASVQGLVLLARPDDNKHFYGFKVSPGYILAGNTTPPECKDLDLLYDCLQSISGHGLNRVDDDISPLGLVNTNTFTPIRMRSLTEEFGRDEQEIVKSSEIEVEVESDDGQLMPAPTPVPLSAMTDPPYDLTDQEYRWYCELKAKMINMNMLNDHDAYMSFHLAQYVIATQGDSDNAIDRMSTVLTYKTKQRLNEVTLEQAWSAVPEDLFCPAGHDRDGRPLVVIDISKFIAKDFANKDRVSLLLRWILNVFNSATTDLREYRKGVTVVLDLKNLSKDNWSLKLIRNLKVKKLLGVAINSFPLRIERIILLEISPKKLNPSKLNGAGALFVPKSVRRIIEFYNDETISQVIIKDQLPQAARGTYIQKLSMKEWREDRKLTYQETCAMIFDSITAREEGV